MKKYIYILSMCTAAMFATSCIGDLDQYPHEDITSESVYTSLQNYKSVKRVGENICINGNNRTR